MLNWLYIKSHEGWYSLAGSSQIFFSSKGGIVSILIPENQFFSVANSVEWADSKFEKYQG
jgi:hypothetical protein